LKAREDVMRSRSLITISALGLAVNLTSWMVLPVIAQQPTVQRKVLLTQDLPIPGYQAVMAAVEIPVGGREGRHMHPGAVLVFVQEGSISVDHEGRANTSYKAGDSIYIEAGKIHEGINVGTVPAKLIATFVVEKGKPLTTPAP
jgi:quercetin dioxygenase-like cupin family protein